MLLNLAPNQTTGIQRLRLTVRGTVQGVGFRPFVYRLAHELNLAGWVRNFFGGVQIEVEGDHDSLLFFLLRLDKEKPEPAFLSGLEPSFLDPCGYQTFEIHASEDTFENPPWIIPDIGICSHCLDETLNPGSRRTAYPFTNCTHCGPRFTLIESLPYDRERTTMREFPLCSECEREYHDPMDRRFHAEPNACPRCGPAVRLVNSEGASCGKSSAIEEAIEVLNHGEILAVKGLGGFHLMADATNEEVIQRLRHRKNRERKPLAVMFESLESVKQVASLSALEARLLTSPEAPIVLVKKLDVPQLPLAGNLAPKNPTLGILLASTPLHQILIRKFKKPLVATSGNVSDEVICTENDESIKRLRGIADRWLVHNRRIARHADDSIARVVAGREMLMRRARGYAPFPLQFSELKKPLLALGSHLKNAIALSGQGMVYLSQHIGDLESRQTRQAFEKVVSDFQSLFKITPEKVVVDFHPDYFSTRFAEKLSLPIVRVQHHVAHILSCVAENDIEGPVLGIAWDGTGYGLDGTIWGGEFLWVDQKGFHRVARLSPFRLPGGERGVREPRRSALGLLHGLEISTPDLIRELPLSTAFENEELKLLWQLLEKETHSPLTSSIGRLFDGVSSLLGLCQRMNYEGEAAMQLEYVGERDLTQEIYPMPLKAARQADYSVMIEADWRPMVREIIQDIRQGKKPSWISRKFHFSLAEIIITMAHRADLKKIVLSGGCFQNRLLLTRTIQRLREEGFTPYWHQRVPANDGGIAVGQLVAANRWENGLCA